MFETFDHTADLGLRIRAATVDDLFADAARALTATLVEHPEAIECVDRVEFTLPPDTIEYHLFDWLNHLLYRFDAEGLVTREATVARTEAGLTASAVGERFDPVRHGVGHEVKAITYHGLKVERADGGWLAEVIVDI